MNPTHSATRRHRAPKGAVLTAAHPVAPDAAASFDATSGDRAALAPGELIVVNLDVGLAAQIALGALPRITAYTADIDALPGAAVALAHVAPYAHAASHANAVWLHANTGPDDVQKLVAEATPLRARAFSVLDMGVAFNVFDPTVVDGLRSGTGYRDLAQDLHAIAAMFHDHWSQLEGRTPLTLADVTAMGTIATRLDEALGLKETGNVPSVNRAAGDRQRAMTLLARSYDEVRRALTWIRWHEDDMEQIAPSLWYRAAGTRSKGATDVPANPPASASATNAPPGGSATNAPPAAPAAAATTVVASAPVKAVEPGPKGTPFSA